MDPAKRHRMMSIAPSTPATPALPLGGSMFVPSTPLIAPGVAAAKTEIDDILGATFDLRNVGVNPEDAELSPRSLLRKELEFLDLPLRTKVHALFDPEGYEEEVFSRYYFVVSASLVIFSFMMILLSVIVFSIESLPEYYSRDMMVFFYFETVCVAWFTFEVVVRFLTSRNKRGFFFSFFNVVDVVAIFPYYLDLLLMAFLGVGSSAKHFILLRAVRLTRVFRVFKLSKYNVGVQLVFISLRQSLDALSLLVFLSVLTVVIGGCSIYFAEQTAADWHADNQTWVRKPQYGGPSTPHAFPSILYGCWWCLVTITTVGYGDLFPVTFPGYFVGLCAMFFGLLIVAFPIIIVGSKFTDVRAEFQAKQAMSELAFREKQLLSTESGSFRMKRQMTLDKFPDTTVSSPRSTGTGTGTEAGTGGATREPSTELDVALPRCVSNVSKSVMSVASCDSAQINATWKKPSELEYLRELIQTVDVLTNIVSTAPLLEGLSSPSAHTSMHTLKKNCRAAESARRMKPHARPAPSPKASSPPPTFEMLPPTPEPVDENKLYQVLDSAATKLESHRNSLVSVESGNSSNDLKKKRKRKQSGAKEGEKEKEKEDKDEPNRKKSMKGGSESPRHSPKASPRNSVSSPRNSVGSPRGSLGAS